MRAKQFITHAARTDVCSSNPSICQWRRSYRLRKPSVRAKLAGKAHGEEALLRARRQNAEHWRWPSKALGLCRRRMSARQSGSRINAFSDLEHAAVGRKADLAQLGQVGRRPTPKS
mgnify:CR=1 FL=1